MNIRAKMIDLTLNGAPVTLAATPGDGEFTTTYDACWDAAMRAADAVGAGLAHHHGIGPLVLGQCIEGGWQSTEGQMLFHMTCAGHFNEAFGHTGEAFLLCRQDLRAVWNVHGRDQAGIEMSVYQHIGRRGLAEQLHRVARRMHGVRTQVGG